MDFDIIKSENFFSNNTFKNIKSNLVHINLFLTALGDNKYYGNYDNKTTQDIFNEIYKCKNKFKYIFFRTEFANTITQNILTYFKTNEFVDYINNKTNLNVSYITTGFISCYIKNCFLSENYDCCKGKIAIIYYLNNIEKINGGTLVINNETFINPKENTLVIMKTYILHKVEPILDNVIWSLIFWMN
jgi:hypothetical protein